jgi:hypothetical protein
MRNRERERIGRCNERKENERKNGWAFKQYEC